MKKKSKILERNIVRIVHFYRMKSNKQASSKESTREEKKRKTERRRGNKISSVYLFPLL